MGNRQQVHFGQQTDRPDSTVAIGEHAQLAALAIRIMPSTGSVRVPEQD